MKVPFSWLKEYLNITQSPEAISGALTLAGLEVEGVEEKEGDLVFEIGLTPNLGHCMSIIGIARELSALLKLPLKRKKIEFQEKGDEAKKYISLLVEDKEQCLFYSCRIVKNAKVAPSPKWLQKKLEACNVRSINAVVDIGNLIMLEFGQPLHLFDYDKIHNKTIQVRAASGNEKITTLDGIERGVPKGLCLIWDAVKPIAVGGVMGDMDSAVSDTTQNILIEAAHFTSQAVRKSSKGLNLRTEGSIRFERGIDPLAITSCLDLAAALLEDLTGGTICKGVVQYNSGTYKPRLLNLSPKRTNALLGTHLAISEISSLLKRLEIEILSETEDSITASVPSYRNDLRAEIDLIEEVGRIYGFNHIPRKLPLHVSSTLSHSPLYVLEKEIRSKLVAQGLQELLTCDLISPNLSRLTGEKTLKEENYIHVLHPASIDQSVLRASLLPGHLEVVRFNLDRKNSSIAAFEVGNIHFKIGADFFEEPVAGIILTGKNAPYHFETKPKAVDFFNIKGHVEDFFEALNLNEIVFEPSHLQNFHPGRQSRVKIGEEYIGVLGEIHPRHLKDLGIEERVYYAEINLHTLLKLKKTETKMEKWNPFPGSERDWTVTVPENLSIGKILEEIRSLHSPILENVYLLDIYRSEKIGTDNKNLTFRFQYRHPTKTVEFEEVEKEHSRITINLSKNI